MVTEWDKLKTDMDKITADLSDIGFVIEWAKLWVPIEKFVDDLVAKNHIQDEQLLQQSLEMEEKEDLLQLANARCNELAKELGEARAENQTLRLNNQAHREIYQAMLMDQQGYIERLEAVREIVEKAELYDDSTIFIKYPEIMEVLGSG